MQKSTKTPNVLIFHHRDLHFVDHLKIESNSYEFLLDTGAESSIITNSLLSSLPLDFSGHTDLACAAKLAIDPVRHYGLVMVMLRPTVLSGKDGDTK